MYQRSQRGSERPYFAMERAIAQNKDLSAEAVATLTYLLSKPDSWLPSATDIARRYKWGKDRVYKVLNELLERGYLVRREERIDGKFTRRILDVFESPVPFPGKPDTAEPDTAEPDTAEPDTVEPDTANPPTRYKREYIRKKPQRKQTTHTTEAPDGAGGVVVSIHSLPVCQQYAQHLHDIGQGINKPTAFADAIYDGPKAGRYDAAITAWLAAPAKPKPKKLHDDPNCPRCQGYGQEYVGGDIGMQRCTAGD